MIKYILAAVLVIASISYEAWNQKKNRDAEWYFKDFRIKDEDFRNKVLAYMVELRTEPENTRRMLRKLAFDDLEMKLKRELQGVRLEHSHEMSKNYNEQKRDLLCNLSGRIDGLNFALDCLEASKPKSYRLNETLTDPSIPKEAYENYKISVNQMMEEFDKQLEIDKEWEDRKGKTNGKGH